MGLKYYGKNADYILGECNPGCGKVLRISTGNVMREVGGESRLRATVLCPCGIEHAAISAEAPTAAVTDDTEAAEKKFKFGSIIFLVIAFLVVVVSCRDSPEEAAQKKAAAQEQLVRERERMERERELQEWQQQAERLREESLAEWDAAIEETSKNMLAEYKAQSFDHKVGRIGNGRVQLVIDTFWLNDGRVIKCTTVTRVAKTTDCETVN